VDKLVAKHGGRYELGWVEHCDDALAMLERRRFEAFDDVTQSSKLWIHAAQRGLSPIDRVGVSQTSH